MFEELLARVARSLDEAHVPVIRQKDKLDRQYVRSWIHQLAQWEGKSHLVKQLEELFAQQ